MGALLPRRRFLSAAGALASALALPACTGHGRRTSRPASPPGPAARGRPIRVGCIAPFTGPRQATGATAAVSLAAAVAHIDADLGGSYNGFRPQIVPADAALTPADGRRAYAQLVAQKVDAILWCGSLGLAESIPDIVRDVVPVIAVSTDLHSRAPLDPQVPDLTTAAAGGLPVFQTAVPDSLALDLLVDYARTDRDFDTAAMIFSSATYPHADTVFDATCQKYGLRNAVTSGYDGATSNPDLSPQVEAVRAAGAQALVIFAPADEAATIVTLLDRLGARYVDTPTARGRGFKPMVLGGPRATGDPAFARAAGTHAAKGTIGVGYLGGFAGLPGLPIRDWVARFAPSYNGGLLRGGEDAAADALAAVMNAAARASSMQGADIIAALESGVVTEFASTVGFAFAADHHLSATTDELVLTTLESVPESRYTLGQEWSTSFARGFVGPDLLVDFTVGYNRRAHPDVIERILGGHLGTSCGSSYQGADQARMAACRALH